MTRKEQLLRDFEESKERKTVWVSVTVPDCPELEVISNPRENFSSKKDYYDKAYDDNLILKANPGIRIISWLFT